MWAKIYLVNIYRSQAYFLKFFFKFQAIACAVEFDDQHCGIYAGDADSYVDFADVFTPIICEYHGLDEEFKHTSDMDASKIKGNINPDAPVKSTRIRVGRSINGFGLSPGITKEQRLEVENLMKNAFEKLSDDLAGKYFPLLGMEEADRQQLVDDHFLFVSGDKNLISAGMERDWPEGRGIFHNESKSFLVWVNEEDQLRIISMEKGTKVHLMLLLSKWRRNINFLHRNFNEIEFEFWILFLPIREYTKAQKHQFSKSWYNCLVKITSLLSVMFLRR